MLHQFLFKTFICSLLLINCFAGALMIMTQYWCTGGTPDVCFFLPNCLIDFKVFNAILSTTPNVGFAICHKHLLDINSWVSMPAPNNTFYICIQDTPKCLSLTYSFKEAALQVILTEKNEQYTVQRWKRDGGKLINFWPNWCAEDNGMSGVLLKPCDPANMRQKIYFG